jgi:hypothetical protein
VSILIVVLLLLTGDNECPNAGLPEPTGNFLERLFIAGARNHGDIQGIARRTSRRGAVLDNDDQARHVARKLRAGCARAGPEMRGWSLKIPVQSTTKSRSYAVDDFFEGRVHSGDVTQRKSLIK